MGEISQALPTLWQMLERLGGITLGVVQGHVNVYGNVAADATARELRVALTTEGPAAPRRYARPSPRALRVWLHLPQAERDLVALRLEASPPQHSAGGC